MQTKYTAPRTESRLPETGGQGRPKVAAHGMTFSATRLALIAVIDHLESAEHDLTHGRPVSAREEISAAITAIEEAGRADLDTAVDLMSGPPLWQIDARLHRSRSKILPHYLPSGAMGEDGIFRETDEETDRAIIVRANDIWSASTGTDGWRLPGSGLTSLISYLTGKPLNVVADELAQRLNIGDQP